MKGVNNEPPTNVTVSNCGDAGYVVFNRLRRTRRRIAAGNSHATFAIGSDADAGSPHSHANTKAAGSDAYKYFYS
jgi:hypothetical protein